MPPRGYWEMNEYNRMHALNDKKPPCLEYDLETLIKMVQDFRRESYYTVEDDEAILLIETLNEKALKHYCVHDAEIRSCPDPKCKGAGFVEFGKYSGKIECEDALQCDTCQTKWSDPLQ